MKKLLIQISPVFCSALIIAAACSSTSEKKYQMPAGKEKANNAVLIELFTSQGCSSCPPADELLGKYAQENDRYVIPIAFHVDYWNRLGWKDSFSTAAYSQRQRDYAEHFSKEGLYTPQAILNGTKEMVGNDESRIQSSIRELSKEEYPLSVTIEKNTIEKDKVIIWYKIEGEAAGKIMNAALIENKAVTHIKAGENRGVMLDNYNVVRDFKTSNIANPHSSIELQMPAGKSAQQMSIVLFVQKVNNGKVYSPVKQDL